MRELSSARILESHVNSPGTIDPSSKVVGHFVQNHE